MLAEAACASSIFKLTYTAGLYMTALLPSLCCIDSININTYQKVTRLLFIPFYVWDLTSCFSVRFVYVAIAQCQQCSGGRSSCFAFMGFIIGLGMRCLAGWPGAGYLCICRESGVAVSQLQWLTRYLRLTLVFMRDSKQRERFNFCFSGVFC